jgi:hypothetical protein
VDSIFEFKEPDENEISLYAYLSIATPHPESATYNLQKELKDAEMPGFKVRNSQRIILKKNELPGFSEDLVSCGQERALK